MTRAEDVKREAERRHAARQGGRAADYITVRDEFAGRAMTAMCGGIWPDNNIRSEIARRAYLMADEMMKARQA